MDQLLPLEVLGVTFSYLTLRDILIAECVSRFWAFAVNNESIWYGLCHSLPFVNWYFTRRCVETDLRTSELVSWDQFSYPDNWRQALRELLEGRRCALVQVFNKHEIVGLMMSSYDAFAFLSGPNTPSLWNVYYLPPLINKINRLHFQPEIGVHCDRLRAIPSDLSREYDPYVPLFQPSLDPARLVAGQAVEIQFRFDEGDPYGWWKGIVQSTERDPEGRHRIVVAFPQYNNNWATETVISGMKNLKNVGASGKHPSVGGWRLPSTQDLHDWRRRWRVWRKDDAVAVD
eukprot:TRINITY_DN4350_c0_g1_i1.p1 TRINITY_DN4350_c0_g1~~TRINITY_DN4350_c0_g1_i1.p1  ORF type:complete len:295 (+),score=31.10 TRINITY_DN4350_c0_g1_i1:23-886(+)